MSTAYNNQNEGQYQSNEGKNKHEGTANENHSFTENAEPDYGNDLIKEEFGKEEFNNENLGQDDHSEKLGNNQFGEELNEQTADDEFNNDELDNEVPDLNQKDDDRS